MITDHFGHNNHDMRCPYRFIYTQWYCIHSGIHFILYLARHRGRYHLSGGPWPLALWPGFYIRIDMIRRLWYCYSCSLHLFSQVSRGHFWLSEIIKPQKLSKIELQCHGKESTFLCINNLMLRSEVVWHSGGSVGLLHCNQVDIKIKIKMCVVKCVLANQFPDVRLFPETSNSVVISVSLLVYRSYLQPDRDPMDSVWQTSGSAVNHSSREHEEQPCGLQAPDSAGSGASCGRPGPQQSPGNRC